MASIQVRILSDNEIQGIHRASLAMLRDTGILIHHEEVLRSLGENGAKVDCDREIARFPEKLVMDCVARAGKRYILHGRNPARVARFGYGDLNQMSSPGQYGWIDSETHAHRTATLEDVRAAIKLGDALPNLTIVGSMGQPREVSEKYREVVLTAELLKGSSKPTRTWVYNGATARYVLEMYRAIAGGDATLRQRPMTEAFLEPISPLQMPREGLDMVIEYVRSGQPVSVGPMSMTSGTAPGTLAGTLAQENAEVLAGVVITQVLGPGIPMMYGGIPHIMDPRTSICSFGSPEQGLMGAAMVQMGRFYGFPVYINVGLTDAKTLDVQAGIEKGATLMIGALAGADTFGHTGICGTDHGASLEWLVADDETMAYVKANSAWVRSHARKTGCSAGPRRRPRRQLSGGGPYRGALPAGTLDAKCRLDARGLCHLGSRRTPHDGRAPAGTREGHSCETQGRTVGRGPDSRTGPNR